MTVTVENTARQRLYIDSPQLVFAAQVNMTGTIIWPITSIIYDNVTIGAFGDVQTDMLLTLGTAPGLDDCGRVRVQNLPDATQIPVGRVSEGYEDGTLKVSDNLYVSIYEDWRIWAKIPYITLEVPPHVYKDADVAMGDYLENPPPVCNIGCGVGDTIDPISGVITVGFDAGPSFAVASGATIVSFAWDIKDGALIAGTLTSSAITATFPPGRRWVACTVVDSNGKPFTTRVPVVARDPDDDICVQKWLPTQRQLSQKRGQTVAFRILEDLPRSTYADGVLVMWWNDDRLNAADRSHMNFIGWHQSDSASVEADEFSLLRQTVLECVDVGGRLATLPGFPQVIEIDDPEADPPQPDWTHMPAPNLDFYIHHLLLWHSTALSLADYHPSGSGDTYSFVTFQSDGATLYEQVDNKAHAFVPDHAFLCDKFGALWVRPDPMLQDVADRSSDFQGSFLEQDWNNLRLTYARPPKVNWLHGSALQVATEWIIVDGEKTLATLFSVAPGLTPSQGTDEVTQGNQLALSQTDLNACTGHRYARRNARYGLITVGNANVNGNVDDMDPANIGAWVQLVITSATAPQRGIEFDVVRCQVHEINFTFRSTEVAMLVDASVVLEVETVGLPAVTEPQKDELAVGEAPPNAPVITRIGDAIVHSPYGIAYVDAGATASDVEDGDLTAGIVSSGTVVTSIAGTYLITYNVTDSDGDDATEVTRTVIVDPNSAPVITLLGSSSLSVGQGDSYTDDGASALDAEEGDITADIVTGGFVDTSTIGTYILTYDVSDSWGLAATQVTRTVNVVAAVVAGITVLQEWTFSNVNADQTLTLSTPLAQWDVLIWFDIRHLGRGGILAFPDPADNPGPVSTTFADLGGSSLHTGVAFEGACEQFAGTDANGVTSLLIKLYGMTSGSDRKWYGVLLRGCNHVTPAAGDQGQPFTAAGGADASDTLTVTTPAAAGSFAAWAAMTGLHGNPGNTGTALTPPSSPTDTAVLSATSYEIAKYRTDGFTTIADTTTISRTFSAPSSPSIESGLAAMLIVVFPV